MTSVATTRRRRALLAAVCGALAMVLALLAVRARQDDQPSREAVPADLTYTFDMDAAGTTLVLTNPNKGWRLDDQNFSVLVKAGERIQGGFPGRGPLPPGVTCCRIDSLGPGESESFRLPTFVRRPDNAVILLSGPPGWQPA